MDGSSTAPDSPDPPALPETLEEALFEAYFGSTGEARDAAVRDLVAEHPEHSALLTQRVEELRRAEKMVPGETVAAQRRAASGPERIGPFRILERLGEGGFGVVYLAQQDEPLQRQVAVKVLLPGMGSERVLYRFEAERQALALMSHPNVAAVLDAGQTDEGMPYFAMEYVAGQPVTEYCDRKRLSNRERLRLFLDVCAGVQHAHQKGVIHRDLKPANILVTERDGAVPKIIDFGVAKALGRRLSTSTLHTQIGRMVGTPEYMSPEQADTRGVDIDTRTDVYSLGVVLYELLVGCRPFEPHQLRDAGLLDLVRIIRETDPPKPSTRWTTITGSDEASAIARCRQTQPGALVSELRGDLDRIVMKALSKDRDGRYATVTDFATDIRRYLADLPVTARSPSGFYVFRKFVRRHRLQVGALALALLAVIGGGVASLLLWQRARDSLRGFERLSDLVVVERYRKLEHDLWPAIPEKVDDLQRWCDGARLVVTRLDDHRAAIQQLRAAAHEVRPGTWEFASERDQFRHDSMVQLVEGLAGFADKTIPSVERRLAWAREVRKRTIDEHAAAWKQAIATVAADSRFAGFTLREQVGLVPLGVDPVTKLCEFVDPYTGAIPQRGADGRLKIGDETGVVFVLLSGGSTLIGSQNTQRDQPNFDPAHRSLEQPVRDIVFQPILVSKYEMTQGQWMRHTGENPSAYKAGAVIARKPLPPITFTLAHPVEDVSWNRVHQVMFELGYQLPSGALWEYACRGGTGTVFYTGNEVSSLQGHANIADAGAASAFPAGTMIEKSLNDGFVFHAPVGSLQPNRFGLHDMAGNVGEWCCNWIWDRENEGIKTSSVSLQMFRESRGGSFVSDANWARSAARTGAPVDYSSYGYGVRPVRRLR